MNNFFSANRLLAVAVFVLSCGFVPALAQKADPQQIVELRRLRDELKASDGLRSADAVVIISERAVAEAAQQFLGLEIKMASGNVVKLNSIECSLATGAAILKLGLQYKSVNLQLAGRIASGQISEGLMRLPIRVTEVKLQNGGVSGLLVKTLFGEWLKPETWNEELPSLDFPLELNETLEVPASRLSIEANNSSGESQLPMEIATPAYRVPIQLKLTSLLVMDKRIALGLQINPTVQPVEKPVAETGTNGLEPMPLGNEIFQLAASLTTDSDVQLRLSRNFITSLLTTIATQQNPDLNFKLKQGRLRTTEINAGLTITNYTDVESGEGQADVSDLKIESVTNDKLNLRLSGQGTIDARVKGREFGVPYGLSPRTSFVIQDQPIPMQFVSENDKVILRALPGATLPINVRFSLNIAGKDLGINRTEVVQVDRWLSRIELPALLNREIMLPRKMEVDAGSNIHSTEKQKLIYSLSYLKVNTGSDAVVITADVKLTPR
ncbi:MAG TPA: hypothetical protein PLK30_13585 [Blastocatellia bacterium]|nr:hypothetical protein [Blastocatellia bacterium]